MMMKWTQEKPAKEGWYWFKGDDAPFNKFFREGTIVYFHPDGSVSMVGTDDVYRLDDFSGERAGPLQQHDALGDKLFIGALVVMAVFSLYMFYLIVGHR